MWGRIKLDQSDKIFSKYIRKKAHYRCQNPKCGRFFAEGLGLQCSHYWSRSHESTRYDDENCIALCINCHNRWGGDYRHEYEAFMKKRLGENGYKILMFRAHSYKKRDRKLSLLIAKELLRSLC